MYLGVAYITYATQGFYVYTFLDPSKEHAKLAAYILGILAAAIVIFVIVNLVKLLLKRTTHARLRDPWRERYDSSRMDSTVKRGKGADIT